MATLRACRREERQDAREAKAFEAACQAKALVKSWKKPRLSPGQSCLPSELWGQILQQSLTEDCLWDLPSTVQWLCHVSTVCKGLHAAVQQHAWPHLCQLLSPLCPAPATQRCKYQTEGQLPGKPDVLVTDPASLRVPELRAACVFFSLRPAGELSKGLACLTLHCLLAACKT